MYDVFNLPVTSFPPGFLWGSASAGHQIEGDNRHSNWWAMERGELPAPAWIRFEEPSGKACNSWEMYREDVELLSRLGHQAYRLSIEWSRIEPTQGIRDMAAVARYVDLLQRLVAAGIKPYVTLHHFSHPRWFAELGGFERPDNAEHFIRHLEFLVPLIAPHVASWIVFNEFNLGRSPGDGAVKRTYIRTHARAYHLIHAHSTAPVSTSHAYQLWQPLRVDDKFDQAMSAWCDFATNGFWFHAIRTGELIYPGMDVEVDPLVKGSCDYWAVNYYTRQLCDARRAGNEGVKLAHKKIQLIDKEGFWFNEFYPEGLITCLERIADLPVIISENGCSSDDDRWRIVYLALHLSALREAIDRGVDVRGYLYWSLMDNYEWGSYKPRFGLVDVDRQTFARTPKPSAWFLRDIIGANAMTPAMIREHLSELPSSASPAG